MYKVYKVYDKYTENIVIAKDEDQALDVIATNINQNKNEYINTLEPLAFELIGERVVDGRTCKELVKYYNKPFWLKCEDNGE